MKVSENISICIQTINKAGLEKLLMSNSIIKMSPSFATAFSYYLTHALLFTNLDFSLKNLTAEFCFFVGIILLNTVFRATKRATFLRITGFLYILTNMLLIPLLQLIKVKPELPAIAWILVYTGLNALFFEIFSLPIVGIFLEICPENLEGFFMSLIFFMNNFSRNIGNFLGTVCIYALKINSTDLMHLNWLIIIHFSISFIGFCVLLASNIPDKKKTANQDDVDQFENNYLAYINTKDSIVLDDDFEFDKERYMINEKDKLTMNSSEKNFELTADKQISIQRSLSRSYSIN